jgi:hypothetical protein
MATAAEVTVLPSEPHKQQTIVVDDRQHLVCPGDSHLLHVVCHPPPFFHNTFRIAVIRAWPYRQDCDDAHRFVDNILATEWSADVAVECFCVGRRNNARLKWRRTTNAYLQYGDVKSALVELLSRCFVIRSWLLETPATAKIHCHLPPSLHRDSFSHAFEGGDFAGTLQRVLTDQLYQHHRQQAIASGVSPLTVKGKVVFIGTVMASGLADMTRMKHVNWLHFLEKLVLIDTTSTSHVILVVTGAELVVDMAAVMARLEAWPALVRIAVRGDQIPQIFDALRRALPEDQTIAGLAEISAHVWRQAFILVYH